MAGTVRSARALALAALLASPAALPGPAGAADPGRVPAGRRGFVATCEDLGQLCTAAGCGRDQIEAERDCRRGCPSAVTMAVVPGVCARLEPVLRRRG